MSSEDVLAVLHRMASRPASIDRNDQVYTEWCRAEMMKNAEKFLNRTSVPRNNYPVSMSCTAESNMSPKTKRQIKRYLESLGVKEPDGFDDNHIHANANANVSYSKAIRDAHGTWGFIEWSRANPDNDTDVMDVAVAKTGAVRSADVGHMDYSSMPWIGIMAVARTSAEGASKYGRFNYMNGFSVHDILNHAFGHMIQYNLGDRSEPHLAHAAWNVLTAIQMEVCHPELSRPHMLGPGATMTPEVQAHLAEQAPILKAKRDSGELRDAGNWKIEEVPEIKHLIELRARELARERQSGGES